MEMTGEQFSECVSRVAHELKFWTKFVQTPRFIDGWVAPMRTPELQQKVYDFLKAERGKVLDVGSGAVSILNGTVYNLTATDPLGELYECIFNYSAHGIVPPLPIAAEQLKFIQEFDVVHCSNALDHSADPYLAYKKMLAAVKPGGHLIIQGFENEGVFENYQGFHQWNICVSDYDSKLSISNKDGRNEIYENPVYCTSMLLDTGKPWFIWIVQK